MRRRSYELVLPVARAGTAGFAMDLSLIVSLTIGQFCHRQLRLPNQYRHPTPARPHTMQLHQRASQLAGGRASKPANAAVRVVSRRPAVAARAALNVEQLKVRVEGCDTPQHPSKHLRCLLLLRCVLCRRETPQRHATPRMLCAHALTRTPHAHPCAGRAGGAEDLRVLQILCVPAWAGTPRAWAIAAESWPATANACA